MKKMLLGIILMLAILAAVSVNSRIINNKVTEVKDDIIESLALPPAAADNFLKENFRKWEENVKYLRIIISESRLEKISEAYFVCMNSPDSIILRNKLIYELDQLIKSEKICLQSIF